MTDYSIELCYEANQHLTNTQVNHILDSLLGFGVVVLNHPNPKKHEFSVCIVMESNQSMSFVLNEACSMVTKTIRGIHAVLCGANIRTHKSAVGVVG